MQIISRSIDKNARIDLPGIEAGAQDVLFLDIETTGIKRSDNRVWLIGCICMQPDGWHLTQWFDDTGLEEKTILSSFLLFAGRFRYVINYNGNRFDLPFLRVRIEENDLVREAAAFLSMSSIDLYGYIAPYRHLLGLPDYRQQTVENALQAGRTREAEKNSGETPGPDAPQTGRDRVEDGKALVEAYKKYLLLPSRELLERLTRHNEANVTGLLDLLCLSSFSRLDEMKVTVRRAQANYYTDYAGEQAEELLVHFALPFSLPVRIYAGLDHCYLKIDGETGVLKIPLYTGVMKYFYANYKDYYYLPGEDMAIHKYIASYVDKNRRIQARPETCYTKKDSTYLPQWSLFRTPFFKRAYEEKEIFFEFTDQMKRDRESLSAYASYVLNHIIFRK